MSTIFLPQFSVHYSFTLYIFMTLYSCQSRFLVPFFFFLLPNILLWFAAVCMRVRLAVALPVPFPRVIVCLWPGLSAAVSVAVLQSPSTALRAPVTFTAACQTSTSRVLHDCPLQGPLLPYSSATSLPTASLSDLPQHSSSLAFFLSPKVCLSRLTLHLQT